MLDPDQERELRDLHGRWGPLYDMRVIDGRWWARHRNGQYPEIWAHSAEALREAIRSQYPPD